MTSVPGFPPRRKSTKSFPKLPLSAFTPPSSGTSETFPLPPSPATAHPNAIVDANVAATPNQLVQWKQDVGETLSNRIGAVVLSLQGKEDEVDKVFKELKSSAPKIQVLSVAIPFRLDDHIPATLTAYLSSDFPISLCTVYTEKMSDNVDNLRWALQHGRPVDIDIQANMHDANTVWENFEDLITKATQDLQKAVPIVLTNVLPPPYAHTLPLVQLMNHPSYRAFQTQIASLSLFPSIYVKFLPPAWEAPTPPAPSPGLYLRSTHLILSQTPVSAVTPSSASPASGLWGGKSEEADKAESQQLKDWKRRIRMYLGPVVEAFGYSRIIFGSSPSPSSHSQSNAGDWYQIARDSLLELGVDQEAVDSVFGLNAKKVYDQSP